MTSRRMRWGAALVVAATLAAYGAAAPEPSGRSSAPARALPPAAAAGSASPPSALSPSALSPSGLFTSGLSPSVSPPRSSPIPALPRGGRTLLPRYRLVGYVGAPASPALGRLGVGDLDARAREIERRAKPFAAGRDVMPVLELVATLAHRTPGHDGRYRTRATDAVIRRYLAAARRVSGLLLLNIQPGRSDFLPEVRAYDRWLREPDVGLALDPEWAVGRGQVPGRVFGSTTGRELDQVARHVAGIVRRYNLPDKVLVFHQLHASIVRDTARLRAHKGVALIKSVDGIGNRAQKESTWRKLTRGLPPHTYAGFKLFYEEDTRHGRLMTVRQVLALRPTPVYVVYE